MIATFAIVAALAFSSCEANTGNLFAVDKGVVVKCIVEPRHPLKATPASDKPDAARYAHSILHYALAYPDYMGLPPKRFDYWPHMKVLVLGDTARRANLACGGDGS